MGLLNPVTEVQGKAAEVLFRLPLIPQAHHPTKEIQVVPCSTNIFFRLKHIPLSQK